MDSEFDRLEGTTGSVWTSEGLNNSATGFDRGTTVNPTGTCVILQWLYGQPNKLHYQFYQSIHQFWILVQKQRSVKNHNWYKCSKEQKSNWLAVFDQKVKRLALELCSAVSKFI